MTLKLTSSAKASLRSALRDPASLRQVVSALAEVLDKYDELDVTPGVATAGKAVVLDANAHTSAVKTAAIHLGASGSTTLVSATAAEMNRLAGVTPGTAAAGKAVILDADADVTGVRHLIATGSVQAQILAAYMTVSAATVAGGDVMCYRTQHFGEPGAGALRTRQLWTTLDGQYVDIVLASLEDGAACAASVLLICRQEDGAVHLLAERRCLAERTRGTAALVGSTQVGMDLTTFDEIDTEIEFTTDVGQPLVYGSDHGYGWNDVIQLKTSDTLPANLEADTDYYVGPSTDDVIWPAESPWRLFLGKLTECGEINTTQAHGLELNDAVIVYDPAETKMQQWPPHGPYYALPQANPLAFYLRDEPAVPQTTTADPETDLLTCAGHGYAFEEEVRFIAGEGGVLPQPLQPNRPYFVYPGDVDTFQVMLATAGNPIDLTTAGSGTWYSYSAADRLPGVNETESRIFGTGEPVIPGDDGTGTHESYQLMPLSLAVNDTDKTLVLRTKGLAGKSLRWMALVEAVDLAHGPPE